MTRTQPLGSDMVFNMREGRQDPRCAVASKASNQLQFTHSKNMGDLAPQYKILNFANNPNEQEMHSPWKPGERPIQLTVGFYSRETFTKAINLCSFNSLLVVICYHRSRKLVQVAQPY
jgi:hypothetical protein